MKTKLVFRSVLLVFLCFSLLTVATPDVAYAIKFLNGKLDVSGFLRNDSAWRVRDGGKFGRINPLTGSLIPDPQSGLDAGDYVLCRNTFQLEIEYKATDWLTLFVMPRLVYEASLDIDDDLRDRLFDWTKHDYIYDTTIREAYADIFIKNTRIRFGKQQIMWGEADLFRMADVINPLDVSWMYLLYSSVSSFEDIRIPLWGLDILWSQPTGHEWALELVWLPGCIEDGFEPVKIPPEGANWNLGHPQFLGDSFRVSEPEDDISNSEFGARVKAVFWGADMSLFYFYSRMDSPTPKRNLLLLVAGGASTDPKYGPASQLAPPLPIYAGVGEYFRYPFVNKIGATFNRYEDVTKTIWRFECVYTIDEPINDVSIIPVQLFIPALLREGYYECDTFQYMFGFDRPTMIRFLNPNRSFLLSFQFFQRFVFDFDDDVMYDHHPGGNQGHDNQTIITFLANTGYAYDTIAPQLLLAFNFRGEGFINPQVEKWLGDDWRIGVGAHIMLSNNNTNPFFGTIRDNDQIYAWLKYHFD